VVRKDERIETQCLSKVAMGVTANAVLSAFVAAIPLVAQAEGKDAAGQVLLAREDVVFL
jgi:hypothetical protein